MKAVERPGSAGYTNAYPSERAEEQEAAETRVQSYFFADALTIGAPVKDTGVRLLLRPIRGHPGLDN